MPNPEGPWGILPLGTSVDPGIVRVIELLNEAGWKPRTRWGQRSIRLWPDGHRPQQITIDFTFPLADQRLAELEERTGVKLTESAKEDER